MKNGSANILLIGFGHHAKRIYYPVLQKDADEFNFRLVYGVDLDEKRQEIDNYLKERGDSTTQMYYIPSEEKTYDELSLCVEERLDEIVDKFDIKGVIISTEPLTHMVYARWALRKGLSVLMDKPISVKRNASTSESAAEGIVKDYEELVELYQEAKERHGRILFSLMAQRRFHPAFCKIRGLISEVFWKTNCPVTSIQSFYADGQWRLPAELIELDYHSFNQGYGQCSHSGYHLFDIVPWLMEASRSKEKEINNVDVFVNFLRPIDFIRQLNLRDYRRFFPDCDEHNAYSESELENLYKGHGEIDAFCSFAFRSFDRTITLGSINLAHNSFSQRGWATTQGRDLYKGNGRVRHESHFIEQGPFQAISLISYQSEEVDPNMLEGLYEVGGEYHLDIHIFRNSKVFPEWKNYQSFSLKDLSDNVMEGKSRGHQEDARRRAILEFVAFLNGREITPVSDLSMHRRGTRLLYGVYKSAVNRFLGKNPLVNIDF